MRFLKTLFECFFVWRFRPNKIDHSICSPCPFYEDVDVIIVHAGGDRVDGQPGEINKYLVDAIFDVTVCIKRVLPVIAQGEMTQCLADTDFPLLGNIPSQRNNGAYIDTVDVAKAHKRICEEYGFKKPILVSYQPHLWRAYMVSKKIGLDVIVADVPDCVYEPECSQKWMRHWYSNAVRELACRLVWLFQGKI
ncbi:MAG: hypothetical protein WCT19_00500 [Candidatus Paceibacterota bacterium]